MAAFKDLTGQRFGRLVVIAIADRVDGQRRWLCRCDCGVEKLAVGDRLRGGILRSCGCSRALALITHGHCRTGRVTKEYRIWCAMIGRCSNPTDAHWSRYGGRGISVCQRWRESFAAFLEDIGPRPSPKHTLDRTDNNGNYEPGNCRWATRREQALNRENTVRVTLNGKVVTLAEACESAGIHINTVRGRISRGWDVQRAVTERVLEGGRS